MLIEETLLTENKHTQLNICQFNGNNNVSCYRRKGTGASNTTMFN